MGKGNTELDSDVGAGVKLEKDADPDVSIVVELGVARIREGVLEDRQFGP
jgi:hypothetical protein